MDCAIVINSVLPSSRDSVLESECNDPTTLKPAKDRRNNINYYSGYHRFQELSKFIIAKKLITQRV